MRQSGDNEHLRWWRLPFFLQRVHSDDVTTQRKFFSHPYTPIAVIAVCISLAAMIVSLNVSRGFQREISNRVVGFLGHLQLVSLDRNASYEQHPVDTIAGLTAELSHLKAISRISTFAQKPGVVKTASDMQGCVVKGYGQSKDLIYFADYLRRGRLPNLDSVGEQHEVLISEFFCRTLGLDTGKRMTVYFVEQPPRVRQYRIVGVYETKFESFDKTYLFTDLASVRTLNGWSDSQVGGYEIRLRNLQALDATKEEVEELELGRIQSDGTMLRVVDVRDTHAALFDWLSLQDINVIVLFTLMLLVSGVNMISVLLILILERTRMIGLLKAFGAASRQLRLLFLLYTFRPLGYGILCGNLLGMGLSFSQYYWRWIHLSPSEYYVDYIPVELNFWTLLLVNLGTLLVTLGLLLLTTRTIERISPSESLRRA